MDVYFDVTQKISRYWDANTNLRGLMLYQWLSVRAGGGGGSAAGVCRLRGNVPTGADAMSARSVEGQASVCTGADAMSARSVEAAAYASTIVGAMAARSAEAAACASTGDGELVV